MYTSRNENTKLLMQRSKSYDNCSLVQIFPELHLHRIIQRWSKDLIPWTSSNCTAAVQFRDWLHAIHKGTSWFRGACQNFMTLHREYMCFQLLYETIHPYLCFIELVIRTHMWCKQSKNMMKLSYFCLAFWTMSATKINRIINNICGEWIFGSINRFLHHEMFLVTKWIVKKQFKLFEASYY